MVFSARDGTKDRNGCHAHGGWTRNNGEAQYGIYATFTAWQEKSMLALAS